MGKATDTKPPLFEVQAKSKVDKLIDVLVFNGRSVPETGRMLFNSAGEKVYIARGETKVVSGESYGECLDVDLASDDPVACEKVADELEAIAKDTRDPNRSTSLGYAAYRARGQAAAIRDGSYKSY